MNDWKRYLAGLHPHLLAWIWTILLLVQVGLAFFVFTEPISPGLMIAGWVVWAVGVVFAIVPILTLRTRGGVPEGKRDTEGHHFGQAGHQLGHCFRVRSCPTTVQQRYRSAEGFLRRLPEAKWLINQVKVVGMWPEAVLWFSPVVVQFRMCVLSPTGLLSAQHF
jgi:hypothetical protein